MGVSSTLLSTLCLRWGDLTCILWLEYDVEEPMSIVKLDIIKYTFEQPSQTCIGTLYAHGAANTCMDSPYRYTCMHGHPVHVYMGQIHI